MAGGARGGGRAGALADRGAADWRRRPAASRRKLEKMERAEKVLRTLPEADARRAAVDRVREDLERALAPRLEAVLRAGEADKLPGLYALYERLGLGDAFRRTYAEARPFAARNVWFAGDAGGALAPRLAAFLDALLAEAIAERAAQAVGRRGPGGGGRGARRARGARRSRRRSPRRCAAAAASLDDCAACADARAAVADLARPGLDAGSALVLDVARALVDAFAVSRRPRRRRRARRRRRLRRARGRRAARPRPRTRRVPRRRRGHGQRRGRLPGDGRGGAALRGAGRRRRGCRAAALRGADGRRRRARLRGGRPRGARRRASRGLRRPPLALVPAASGLPRDPSLPSYRWAHAREAVYALDVAGVLARDARAWPDAAQRAFDAWRADGADAPPAAAGLAPPPLPPVARRAARRAGGGRGAAARRRGVALRARRRGPRPGRRRGRGVRAAFECALAPVRRALRAYWRRAAPDPPGATTYCRPVAWAAAPPPRRRRPTSRRSSASTMPALRHLEPFLGRRRRGRRRCCASRRSAASRTSGGPASPPRRASTRATAARSSRGGAVADEDGGGAGAGGRRRGDALLRGVAGRARPRDGRGVVDGRCACARWTRAASRSWPPTPPTC